MKLKTKVAINTIIQITSKFIATLLGLVAIGLITRYLGQNGFGEYTTVLTFLSFFAIIADLGFTLVTVQIISQPNADEERMLGNLFALRIISAFIIIGLAPIVVLFFPYSTEIKQAILITTLAFFFISLNQVLVGFFQKRLRMDKVSISEVASRIVLLVGILWAIKVHASLVGILLATIGGNFVSFIILYLSARKFVPIKLHFDFHHWKEIIQKTWPLAITITLNLIYLKSDTLLLSIIPRESKIGILSEVGIYGAAYKVIDVLITLPFMFAGIILPILTARWTLKRKDEFKQILQKSTDLMIIIAIPLIVGSQLVAGQIMEFVAGDNFYASGPILKLLILAAAAIFIGNIPAHAVIAIDKQKKIIPAYIFVAITSLIGYLVLIPKFSYWGAAWMTIYSEVVIAIASFYLVYKYTKFILNPLILIKSIASAALMYFLVYPLVHIRKHGIIITIPAAMTLYTIALILFKGISKEDFIEIIKQK